MWAANQKPARTYPARASKQKGVAAVEFALLAIIFFTLVFGILEIARLIFLFNTLPEVTRRAAAMAINAPFDQGSQDNIRRRALFPDRAGNLILGEPVAPAHLQLEYLSLSRGANGALTMEPVAALPLSPEDNRINCLADPYSENCIRFVRVQVCQPDSANGCRPVPYQMLFPLINLSGLTLPRSETVAPAQTMGYTAGVLPVP